MIDFILEIPLNVLFNSLNDLFRKKPTFTLARNYKDQECLLWGDPIPDAELLKADGPKWDADVIVKRCKGHFYFLFWNHRERVMTIGNSLFSVLPVYYRMESDRIVIAANALDIAEYMDSKKISRRFVLETMLFNYPLFNDSVVKGINLLPCNSNIKISADRCFFSKHTSVTDHFQTNPKPWRKALTEMSEVFLCSVRNYLPENRYFVSLTGGFDGRTLAAAGLYLKKNFACYTFGVARSADVAIATRLIAAAKVPFLRLDLDETYAREKALGLGLEFIRGASGNATFARAHYLYAARELAKKTEYIITGNFGSEVFRAAHVPGVVIAPNLFRLFDADSLQEGIRAISNSSEFSYLNCRNFRNEWEELKVDLERLPRFNAEYRSLSRNQQFYIFVFEEIFRKYFGAEIINQFHYVKNRTPFLDWDFLKAIFQTGLAGIYSSFFEHNPIKRYKGQVLYAHIIRKTYPEFGLMMTDKGYRPDDLTTWEGKISIICGYIKKRINRKILMKSDPYSVIAAFESNRNVFNNIEIDSDWFNAERISKEMNANPGEALFKPLSLAYIMGLMEHR